MGHGYCFENIPSCGRPQAKCEREAPHSQRSADRMVCDLDFSSALRLLTAAQTGTVGAVWGGRPQ
ncbi:MAG: hypothetical protein U9R05_01775 [Chloroflexota bacterium]|nr:hypothetical protein [Chloroflexota bacterium]